MKKHSSKIVTAIDLFSGCGGLTAGLRDAGYEVVAAVENDPLACETYRLNHKHTLLLDKDITKIRPEYLRKKLRLKIGELTLLAGCPPCQGFSTLRTLNGGRDINEPMNELIFQSLKFVKVFLPRAIMLENVPGLIHDPRIEIFRSKIANLGYISEVRVLDAADFGTPQRRRRMVLIALKGKAPVFANHTRYKKSVRWAFSRLSAESARSDPLHNYEVSHGPRVRALFKKIPKDGGGRTDLKDEEQLPCHRRMNGFKDVYGRMSWSEPAPTITGGCINPSKGRFVHPDENRAITLREAALLQGFPANYRFDMSRGRYPVAQLIGNAFPPSFAQRHAKKIKETLTRK